MLKLLLVFFTILAFTQCVEDESSKVREVQKPCSSKVSIDSSWTELLISKSHCMAFGIAEVPFKISIPKYYDYELRPAKGGAVRLTPKFDCSTFNEITIGTAAFRGKYSKDTERKWFEEFSQTPEISGNANFKIDELPKYSILGEERNVYLLTGFNEDFNNEEKTGPSILGVLIPSKNGWNGLVIAIPLAAGGSKKSLSDMDQSIINSITFE